MIEIRALEKTFDAAGRRSGPALRGVDLAMPPGQFLTVIGSNGSGKSTILNAHRRDVSRRRRQDPHRRDTT